MRDPARIAPALADLPPSRWADAVGKMDAVERYRSIDRPTEADAARIGAKIGITARSLYRLARSLKKPRPWRTDGPVRVSNVDPVVDELIAKVIRDAGVGATIDAVFTQVTQLAEAEGLPLPGRTQVITRIEGTPRHPDVAAFTRRKADIVLDAAVLSIPLDDPSVADAAWVLAAIDVQSGITLASELIRLPPQLADVDDLLSKKPIEPSSAEPRVLIHTRGIPDISVLAPRLAERGMLLDSRGSKNVDPGRALRAVFGRKLGRMRMREDPPVTPPPRSGTVSIDLAREIVAVLVSRRNDELAKARSSA